MRLNPILRTGSFAAVWFLLSGILILTSCKKDNNGSKNSTGGNNTTTARLSDEDSLKYLMYNIMQVSYVEGGRDTIFQLPTYYWNTSVPLINPLSSIYPVAETLLNDMRNYAINPATGTPYDRYSFLDRTGSVVNELQYGIESVQQETVGNFGMQVSYAEDNSGNTNLYVLYADMNSPAGLAGINRGWEITAINGSSDIAYDGANGTNTNNVVNSVYNSSTTTFTFLEADGVTDTTITLNTATYKLNPILFDSIYSVNGKQVGYFVFYTFSCVFDSARNPTLTQNVLNEEFAKFQTAAVNDVIVDLRYNGGGDVETSQYMDSLLAPSGASGQLMFTYFYNADLTTHEIETGLPSQTLFNGSGGLNLDNVFFIVTRNTASASELTLNNLKPYMSVKLVGDTTYGKPVGFFDFTITDYDSLGNQKYLADLFAINYATENADGVGGYYTGIAPDVEAPDDVNVPWGDATDDNNLSDIFSYISTGNFARTSGARQPNPNNLRKNIRGSIPVRQFNNMVDFRLSKLVEAKLLPHLRKK